MPGLFGGGDCGEATEPCREDATAGRSRRCRSSIPRESPRQQQPAEGQQRLDPRLRKVLQVVISLAIVVGIFWYVLRQFADISEVWDAMRGATWREVVVLVVAATWNLATYWILTVIATPGLRYPQAVVLTETCAVSNALPAGGALGWASPTRSSRR